VVDADNVGRAFSVTTIVTPMRGASTEVGAADGLSGEQAPAMSASDAHRTKARNGSNDLRRKLFLDIAVVFEQLCYFGLYR
jgi:hypothetical protein